MAPVGQPPVRQDDLREGGCGAQCGDGQHAQAAHGVGGRRPGSAEGRRGELGGWVLNWHIKFL